MLPVWPDVIYILVFGSGRKLESGTWREGLKGMALQSALSRLRGNDEPPEIDKSRRGKLEKEKIEQVRDKICQCYIIPSSNVTYLTI